MWSECAREAQACGPSPGSQEAGRGKGGLMGSAAFDLSVGLNTISQMVPKKRFMGKVGMAWFLVSWAPAS